MLTPPVPGAVVATSGGRVRGGQQPRESVDSLVHRVLFLSGKALLSGERTYLFCLFSCYLMSFSIQNHMKFLFVNFPLAVLVYKTTEG